MAKPASVRAHRLLLAFATLVVVVGLVLLRETFGHHQRHIRGPACQSSLIANNLRLLENAKDRWANEYGLGTEPVATWPVLIPYLKGGTIHPVTNEIYSLNTVGFAATARLSVPLGTCAAGSFITVP